MVLLFITSSQCQIEEVYASLQAKDLGSKPSGGDRNPWTCDGDFFYIETQQHGTD
jgi:hypothetical protein